METCKEHSGICATIQAVKDQLGTFQDETKESFKEVKDNIKSVREGFDGFKTWLLYSVLGCAFSILTSIVVMVIKLR